MRAKKKRTFRKETKRQTRRKRKKNAICKKNQREKQSLGTMSVLHRVKHASENCIHLAHKEKQARHVTRFL